jgi:hypothetical protein
MLNKLDQHLEIALRNSKASKRRLITFNIQVRKSPKPNKKWSLNSSLEATYLNKIDPVREKDLTVI